VRLDKFITLVDDRGLSLTIIRRSNKDASQIGLDTSAGGVPPEILGGQISPDFVVIYITYAGQRFLQVHEAKTTLKLVAAIDSEVINYEVLDLVTEMDIFYVLAVTEDELTGVRKLQIIQIVYDSFDKGWANPSLSEVMLPEN